MTLKSHCNHRHTATDSVQRSKHCVRQYSYKSLCYYCARPHLIDQKRPKPCRVQPGLMFHTTDRVRMEQRPSEGDVQVDNTESRLRELALKWFTETQAPLILHNGNFPEWFQGFISRKDAEEHLKDKELGCFLIRLSDKTTGYILSYKGRDRCRHFVINQNKHGGFMVTGDTEMHDTLTSLIEHYRISPIEPFGEYLTLSCFESSTSELYDVVHYAKDKPGVNVKAVKDIWTHQSEKSQTIHPPALPSKAIKNIQDFPHQQRKGPPLKTVSLELKHNPENVIYTKIDLSKPEMCARTSTESKYGASWGDDHKSPTDSTVSQGTIYSELIMPNCRSQSMPFLDNNKEEEEQICRTSQVQLHIGTDRLSGLSSSLDELCNSSLYHLAGTSGNQLTVGKPARSGVNILDSDATYAEIPHEPNAVSFVDDNTYEQIPDSWVFTTRSEKKSQRTNSYEALTDLKPKQTFLRTFKNEKWRWLSPEYWKK